jgi:hypothetical protein
MLFQLIVRGVWVFLVVRLIGWRSTIGNRSFLTYLSLGALLSYTAAAPIQRVVNQYGDASAWLSFILNVLVQLLLLLPLWNVLRGKGAERSLSVSDGFLLAFALGFGFDLMGALPGIAVKAPLASAFNFLPPGSISDPSQGANLFTMAGHGLWIGLIAVVIAAARRFMRSRVAVWIAGSTAFLFCAFDAPALWKRWPFADRWQSLTLHGALTGWLVVAIVIAASLYERRWAGDKQTFHELAVEWLESIQLLLKNPREYSSATMQSRLRRRLQIAQAETSHGAAMDGAVARMDAESQSRVQGGKFSLHDIAWKTAWREAWFSHALCWLLLFAVLLFPTGFNALLFNRIFGYQINVLHESVIDTLLVAFLFWRYLISAGRQIDVGIDCALQRTAERQINRAVLWLAVLGWFYINWNSFFPYPNLFVYLSNGGNYWPQGWNSAQIRTFLLLCGACLSTVTMRSAHMWARAAVNERRVAIVRNLMAILTAGTLVYCSMRNGNYIQGLETFHQDYGRAFYALSVHLGTNGNKLIGWSYALINGLYWAPLAILFGVLTQAAVSFFSDEHPSGSRPLKRGLFSFKRIVSGAGAAIPSLLIVAGLQTLLRLALPPAVFAGTCSSAEDCICIPPGTTDALAPVSPLIDYPFYRHFSGAEEETPVFDDAKEEK